MTDYTQLTTEELRDEYDRVIAEQADRGARGMSFAMNGMVEAGDIKRELRRRDEL